MSWPGAEVRQEVSVESTLPACFDVPDVVMPNAETVVAIEELEMGRGRVFDGPPNEIFETILREEE